MIETRAGVNLSCACNRASQGLRYFIPGGRNEKGGLGYAKAGRFGSSRQIVDAKRAYGGFRGLAFDEECRWTV